MTTLVPQHNYTQTPEIKPVATIGTHSGAFHADEAMAIAILQLIPAFTNATIYRSRDTAFLDTMDMLVDVGSVYDPENLRFDHHQREFTETFSAQHTIRLSSAGLIYKHYGMAAIKEVLKKESLSKLYPEMPQAAFDAMTDQFSTNPLNYDLVFDKIYTDLIHGMDGIDNGVPKYPASVTAAYKSENALEHRISRLNPSWVVELYHTPDDKAKIKQEQTDNVENLAKFKIAIQYCREEFLSQVENAVFSWLAGRSIVADAIADRFNHHASGRIVVSKQFCPWKGHFFAMMGEEKKGKKMSDDAQTISNILFFVYPSGSSWRYLAVPETPSSFEIRVKFPDTFKGVRDDKLEEVSGVAGLTPAFVHHTGFTGGAATLPALLSLLEKVMEYNDKQ